MINPANVKVLLIDDEVEFASTLAERLSLRGYDAAVAETGAAGLALLEKTAFSIVLLDMMLPGMCGTEVLSRIRAQQMTMPVILLTGRASAKDGIQGMKDGASAYLMKPIDLDELLNTMNSLLEGASHA